jgi:radical SAM protein with 4Fe4S-binding SPASM domain
MPRCLPFPKPGSPEPSAAVSPRLRHLTIKPVHGCRYNCPYCASRKELFRKSRQPVLQWQDWAAVFEDADGLGCEYLDISGGEPTLNRDLPVLIWEAKRRGWFVSLNSTGFGIPEALDLLIRVCLDQVIVSLISLEPGRHDSLRQAPGSWEVARRAIHLIAASPLRLIIHLIVNRHNYRELPDLIDFAFACQASGLSLIYPENDAQSRYLLMSGDDIERFRAEVMPECLRRYALHRPAADMSHENLSGLYGSHRTVGDFAAGIYWHDPEEARARCRKPQEFALIYANGDVLPCNSVEYTHSPIAGNVRHQSLKEIWSGEDYTLFRRDRMDFCRLCPTGHHTGIAICAADNPPYAAPVIRRVPDALPPQRPGSLA